MLLPLALTLSLGAPASDPIPDEARIVDMVVARVNDAVVTLSELVARTGLVLLRTRGPRVANDAALSRDLLASVLEVVINEVLLHQEVRRLQLAAISDRQVERAFRRDLARFDRPAQRAEFAESYGFETMTEPGSPPPLWAAVIRRQLAVDGFLDARARLEARPSFTLVLRCYEANADHFAERSFDEAEPEIRARIEAQLRQQTAERLVEDLRRRARITVADGFDRSAAPAPPGRAGFTCPIGDPS